MLDEEKVEVVDEVNDEVDVVDEVVEPNQSVGLTEARVIEMIDIAKGEILAALLSPENNKEEIEEENNEVEEYLI